MSIAKRGLIIKYFSKIKMQTFPYHILYASDPGGYSVCHYYFVGFTASVDDV